jgi:hypothetical protein
MRSVVLLVLFASGGTLLNGCGQGVSRGVLATVLSVRGSVDFANANGKDSRPFNADSRPGAGDILRVSNEAQVDLALVPGALIQVRGNSELIIAQLRLTKDGNETDDGMRSRVARLQLNRGKIDAVLERRDESEIRFSIGTREVTVSADGDCLFQLQSEGIKTRVVCARGKVYVAAPNQPISVIKAGYFQEWSPNGTAAILAAEDAAAQIDVTDALEAERELRELQSRQSVHRPF